MTCQPGQVPTHTPRNMKQLRNLRFKHLHPTRISKDELYNLHEIAYDTPGFVQKIATFPDLVCVCGLQEILDEADKVLMLEERGQLLSYDMTFQLLFFAECHVSQLCSSITNNMSEGLNRVVKEFQSWKEAPLDTIVFALYQLQV